MERSLKSDANKPQEEPFNASFGEFELRSAPDTLLFNGEPIELQAQPLRLLRLLAKNLGQTVDHETIRQELWGDLHIDAAGGMHAAVRQIRKALSVSTSPPEIETIPRRGYRLLSVERSAPLSKHPRVRLSKIVGLIIFLAIGVALVSAILWRSSTNPVGRSTDFYGDAIRAIDAKDFELGRSLLESAIAERPKFAPAYAAKSQLLRLQGQENEALTAARQAVDIDPAYAKGRFALAMALIASEKDWAVAETELRLALRIMPSNEDVPIALANLLAVTGRMEEALVVAEEAASQFPKSARHQARFGHLLYLDRDNESARRNCRAAIQFNPNSSTGRDCLWRLGVQRSDPEALAIARERLASPESAIVAAESYAALGRYDQALNQLTIVEEEDDERLPLMLIDPLFAPISHQRAFEELAQRLGVDLSRGRDGH